MILLFSTNGDYSTKDIAEWLQFYDCKYLRLNNDNYTVTIDNLNLAESTDIDLIFSKGNHVIKVNNSEITAVFYRGGRIELQNYFQAPINSNNIHTITDASIYYLNAYNISRKETLKYLLNGKNSIGNENQGRINKLVSLSEAVKTGIRIPETIVTTSKAKLKEFVSIHTDIIIKSLDLNFSFSKKESHSLHAYTHKLSDNEINELPDTFPLSLFQREIKKSYEIRAFFLKGNFYSMAIFSQKDSDTTIDWRKYEDQKSNRVVPYKLPSVEEKKLSDLMNLLNLNTGSIDIIKCIDGHYYFLEVNPIGQFGRTSGMCNYYLEKKIALALANESN